MLFERIRFSITKRPLAYTLVGFLLTFFLSGFFFGNIKIVLFALMHVIILLVILLKLIFSEFGGEKLRSATENIRLLPTVMILATISAAFILSYLNFDVRFSELYRKYDGKAAEVELTVISNEYLSNFYSSHEVMITEIDGEKCNIKAIMESPYYSDYDCGDSLILSAELSCDNKFSNIAEAYSLSHGILMNISSLGEESTEYLGKKTLFPYTFISNIQKQISLTITRFTNENGGALSRALIYGDRSEMSYKFTQSFKELGLSHMLAISGMHFSIIVGLLAIFFSKIKIPKRFSVVLLIIFVIVYALIAGFSPSVCRAAVMLLFSYLSVIAGKNSDAVTSLFCAVFLICLFNPYAVYDIGLLLSFSSTLGILLIALPINEKLAETRLKKIKPVYSLVSSVNVTLSAVLFTLPISFFCFEYISYISPFSNLIFSPIITVILYILPFLVIFSGLPFVAKIFGAFINIFGDITVYLANSLADTGNYTVDLKYFFCTVLFILTLVYILAMVLFVKNFSKRRELVYIPLVIFVITSYIGNYILTLPYKEKVSLCYYTDQEGDALILSYEGNGLLVDMSNGGYSFAKNAINYAKGNIKTDITAYMITDYHYNHISTVTRLIEYTNIRSFILPESSEKDQNYFRAITQYLSEYDCNITIYTPGENSVFFGDFFVSTYIYESSYSNPASLVFIENEKNRLENYMYASNIDTLFSKDNDFATFVSECAKRSDFLICGAHGESEETFKELGFFDKSIKYCFSVFEK